MKMLPPEVTVVVEERRRRGRPTVGDAEAHFRLSAEDYNAAFRLAAKERVDINDIFRRAIRRLLEQERIS